jgi:hypothetical protein
MEVAVWVLLFPWDSVNLEIFRRVLLEITKRRRFGDDFAPAPRLTLRRRLRVVLFGVLVFRFGIVIRPASTRFGSEKFTESPPNEFTPSLHNCPLAH